MPLNTVFEGQEFWRWFSRKKQSKTKENSKEKDSKEIIVDYLDQTVIDSEAKQKKKDTN